MNIKVEGNTDRVEGMASSKSMWTAELTTLLILEYEAHEILYNKKHVDYKNRRERMKAYQEIAEIISTKARNICTVEDIKKKINGIRSQYLAENTKIMRSMSNLNGSGSVYQSKVYWFDMLKFLDTSNTGFEPVSNLNIQELTRDKSVQDAESDQSYEELIEQDPFKDDCSLDDQSVYIVPLPKKQKQNKKDAILSQTSSTREEISRLAPEKCNCQQRNDECQIFGKFVGNELQGILENSSPHMLRQTKRKLQMVLMEAWAEIDQP